jgi:hypothetical protein
LPVQVSSREAPATICLSAENALVQFLQGSERFFGFELVGQKAAVGKSAIRRVDNIRIRNRVNKLFAQRNLIELFDPLSLSRFVPLFMPNAGNVTIV